MREPFIPGQLVEVGDYREWRAGGFEPSSHVLLEGLCFPPDLAEGIELTESCVRNATAADCGMRGSLATDVSFEGCDFSNADFESAFFERCRFVSCKLMGTQANMATFSNVSFEDCTLRFALFDRACFRDVRFSNCDLECAEIPEAKLLRVDLEACSLARANLFRTSLSGIDLSGCDIEGVVLSDGLGELRGCRLDLWQAAGIARRLGIVVDS